MVDIAKITEELMDGKSSRHWNSPDYEEGKAYVFSNLKCRVVVTPVDMDALNKINANKIEAIVRKHGITVLADVLKHANIIVDGVVDEYKQTYNNYHLK